MLFGDNNTELPQEVLMTSINAYAFEYFINSFPFFENSGDKINSIPFTKVSSSSGFGIVTCGDSGFFVSFVVIFFRIDFEKANPMESRQCCFLVCIFLFVHHQFVVW